MTEFNRIDDVDAFCLKLYSGDKGATLKVTVDGWRRIIDEIGLHLLMAVLQQSTSAYSIMFVSRAASECLETLFGNADELTQFTLSVYELLCVRDAGLNAAAKLALRQLVCVAVQRGYQYSHTLAQMPSSVCASCSSSMQAGDQGDRLRVGCEVLADLVVTLSERRMNSFASDVSIAKSFRDDHLLSVFRLAVRVVKEVQPSCRTVMAAGLRLAQHVLEFDFACDTIHTEAEENPVTRTYPDNWAADLQDVQLMDRLWCLYRIPDLEPDLAHTLLEVLTSLVSLRKSFFTNAELRPRWYAIVLLQTHLVMERFLHLEDEETLSAFARLLNRMKPNCDLSELMQLAEFSPWLRSLCSFTKQCLANWKHASTSLLSLLSVWGRLIEAKSYATQDTVEMLHCGLQVIGGYIECLHSRVQAFTMELAKLMSSDSAAMRQANSNSMPLGYVLDDDEEGARLEVELLLKVVMSCGEEGWKILEANSERVSQSVLEHVRPNAPAVSADHIVLMEEAAWSLHLLSAALYADGAIDSGAVRVLTMLLHSFILLQRFSSHVGFLDNLPGSVRGHVAASTTRVLAAILSKTVSVYVVSNRKTSAFVEQLSSQLRQCGEMEAAGTFGAYFLNVAVHAMWIILGATNVSDEVRVEALQLLDEWTSTSSVLRLLKETRSYMYLLNLHNESIPAPLQHPAALRARYLFIRCVTQVRFLDASALTDSVVNTLMEPVLARVSQAVYGAATGASSAESTDRLTLSLCDMRGILSCTERRPYRVVMDMFEPFLYPLADAVLHESSCGEETVTQLLELVNEMSLNKNQRIVFGAHSAKSVHIFRYVSRVVVRSARLVHLVLEGSPTRPSAQTTSPLVEWGWKVMRLGLLAAQHILQGGWCNLGVLQLYEDTALTSLLSSVWGLLCRLPIHECMVRSKVCAAVIKVVNVLAARFFHDFWAKQVPSEVFTVVGFVESLAFPASVSAVEVAQQNEALQAMDRLVNCCWVRTAYPIEELQQAAVMKSTLLRADAMMFHRLVTCALERSVAVDNHGMRKLLLPLFYVEGSAVSEVAQYFCSRATTPAAAHALQVQFSDIQRHVTKSGDITSKTVDELANALHTLMNTLKESL
ncbi:hypothetical protein GH5_06993 [Leishmania sp. Ghana 2012 LV757]|uniref:hypothetical protein n=1 Tax=Leishmania sp. Ghana 2012 LV757 TaxID=2803181 RepID=UPI001B7906C5|nr:hypothetical protein GH5_06993 [Leishmania sp. Ghana 2012 LV757]